MTRSRLFGLGSLLLLCAGPAQALEVQTLAEWVAAKPLQRAVMRAFSERVSAPPQAPKRAQAEPLRVVLVYPGVQASDYWRRSARAFEARMKALGVRMSLQKHFTRPETEIHQQARLIDEALRAGADYIVFTLDAPRHRRLAERVLNAPGTRLLLQNITTPLRAWGDRQPLLFTGFDHHRGGQLLGRWFLKRFGGQGRYAIIHGTRGHVSAARAQGFRAVIAGAPALRAVDTYYAGFDRARARAAAADLLKRHADQSFIYACSTDIALGAADAVDAAGRRGQVLINGWGGGSAELEAIAAGRLAVTAMRLNDDTSVAMADAISLDAAGESARVPTVYSGQFVIIDEATPAEAVVAARRRAFRYSGAAQP